MGITSSMITGLSGLSANSSSLDVVGNNIANVNTVGFKSSRLDFKTQFLQSFSFGSAPNGDLGGTNPIQVGLGVTNGGVSRDFNDGSREVTGINSNLAMEGDGFFIVKDSEQSYTRDGTFQLNAENKLVNANGQVVQGFAADSSGNIIPGVLQDVVIPINDLTMAQATTSIPVTGGLNGAGDLPTQVANLTLDQPFFVSNGSGGVTGTAPTATTPLSQLADASGNTLLFSHRCDQHDRHGTGHHPALARDADHRSSNNRGGSAQLHERLAGDQHQRRGQWQHRHGAGHLPGRRPARIGAIIHSRQPGHGQ